MGKRGDTSWGCWALLTLFSIYGSIYSSKTFSLASILQYLGLYIERDNWGGIYILLFVCLPLHIYLCYIRYKRVEGISSVKNFCSRFLIDLVIVVVGIIVCIPFFLFLLSYSAIVYVYYLGGIGSFPQSVDIIPPIQSLLLGLTTLATHCIFAISQINKAHDIQIEQQKAKLEKQIESLKKEKEQEISSLRSVCESRIKRFECNWKLRTQEAEKKEAKLKDIIRDSHPFNKVSSLRADVFAEVFDDVADDLIYKPRPAQSASDTVRAMKQLARDSKAECKLMTYKYEFLLAQFPELKKYVDDYDVIRELGKYDNLNDVQKDYDNVRDWISKEEYDQLTVNERNQRALTNYINRRNKSKWQIGRDYEMYIGYLYRKEGWSVKQLGIEATLADMGRDIVAQKGVNIHIVQCKMWSKEKEIHENVICQLYGTTIQYELECNDGLFRYNIKPVLITTTQLSDTAIRFADKLGVLVKVIPMWDNFPRIKCNINNGSKIYHLPFDQQYDKVQIKNIGECYATTVEEATSKGFRRAYRFTTRR